MITKKKFDSIEELQQIQYLASKCLEDVGLHSEDGSIIIDAKSYIGIYALDFKQPIDVVSESKEFHKEIENIGKNV